MLANYVGIEKFLEGVSIYLKRHLYSNTVTHHLWEGISVATGWNITELMENWVTKVCLPACHQSDILIFRLDGISSAYSQRNGGRDHCSPGSILGDRFGGR